ncbi:MAG: glycerol-3-phosphate dehydrogenase, partial [Clostridia bacterium]|nr:glycerol-3-phosphate dehydrogenase [Clostridia bacterium]
MKQSKHISVIGCGRWGSLIAWYLDRMGHEVMLYGRSGSRDMMRFRAERKNDYITLPESIRLTDSLADALTAEITVISVGSQQLRGLMQEMQAYPQTDRIFVLCM